MTRLDKLSYPRACYNCNFNLKTKIKMYVCMYASLTVTVLTNSHSSVKTHLNPRIPVIKLFNIVRACTENKTCLLNGLP